MTELRRAGAARLRVSPKIEEARVKVKEKDKPRSRGSERARTPAEKARAFPSSFLSPLLFFFFFFFSDATLTGA